MYVICLCVRQSKYLKNNNKNYAKPQNPYLDLISDHQQSIITNCHVLYNITEKIVCLYHDIFSILYRHFLTIQGLLPVTY